MIFASYLTDLHSLYTFDKELTPDDYDRYNENSIIDINYQIGGF